ncbi:MAG: FAD-binding protein [Deltaproteobacteria bacterium]|nr:FAD-binding protein [Deltaproteobacteria bacterium]
MERKTIKKFEALVGEDGVLSTPEDLAVYSYDGTFADRRPDLVLLPSSTEQVSRILELAFAEKMPVTARGMGSGLAAASVPSEGGIVLSSARMNRIIELDEENYMVLVEAGIVTADLQAAVEKRGLFYPPDPSSNRQSTIGGNIACNAGGPRCLKYGVTGDYVMGLTVVLPDGKILKTGGKTIKDVVGYDLTSLFTGSEGTLGIITEALLKLVAKPASVKTVRADFPRLDDASGTVTAILKRGIVPATIELMDETAIACIEESAHLGLPLDIEALLIIESDGFDERAVAREIETITKICRDHGAREVTLAGSEQERSRLWSARRAVSPSLARKAPNKLGEDITVPRSAIPETIRRIKQISSEHGLPIVVFGHAGDGNLHPNILFDLRNPDHRAKVDIIAGQIFKAALAVGGTLSGEHGVGTLKRSYVTEALGSISIDVQKRIKAALDPANIMNPGKVLPD